MSSDFQDLTEEQVIKAFPSQAAHLLRTLINGKKVPGLASAILATITKGAECEQCIPTCIIAAIYDIDSTSVIGKLDIVKENDDIFKTCILLSLPQIMKSKELASGAAIPDFVRSALNEKDSVLIGYNIMKGFFQKQVDEITLLMKGMPVTDVSQDNSTLIYPKIQELARSSIISRGCIDLIKKSEHTYDESSMGTLISYLGGIIKNPHTAIIECGKVFKCLHSVEQISSTLDFEIDWTFSNCAKLYEVFLKKYEENEENEKDVLNRIVNYCLQGYDGKLDMTKDTQLSFANMFFVFSIALMMKMAINDNDKIDSGKVKEKVKLLKEYFCSSERMKKDLGESFQEIFKRPKKITQIFEDNKDRQNFCKFSSFLLYPIHYINCLILQKMVIYESVKSVQHLTIIPKENLAIFQSLIKNGDFKEIINDIKKLSTVKKSLKDIIGPVLRSGKDIPGFISQISFTNCIKEVGSALTWTWPEIPDMSWPQSPCEVATLLDTKFDIQEKVQKKLLERKWPICTKCQKRKINFMCPSCKKLVMCQLCTNKFKICGKCGASIHT